MSVQPNPAYRDGRCFVCGGRRWVRRTNGPGWTCYTCHGIPDEPSNAGSPGAGANPTGVAPESQPALLEVQRGREVANNN